MNLINKLFGKRSALQPNDRAANNLFGTIATNMFPYGDFGFYPIDNKGGVMTPGDVGATAQWLGLNTKNMQYWAYQYCSPLAAVIDRLSECDTNGRLEFVNDKQETVKVNKNPRLSRIKKLMLNPNPYQTWEEFNSQQVVLAKIFGYCPVYIYRPVGLDASYAQAMYNLNPYYAQPTANYNFKINDGSKNTIESWMITILGTTYTILSEDIILISDGYIASPNMDVILPTSKIAGLDFFVSNICAAMEADNVLLKKKGPLGIFSYDPKPDMAGWQPMTVTGKDEIQKDLDKYGLTHSQLQHVISKLPLKWNAMSFNVRDLMTKETVRQGIDGICDRFAYPAELMSGKNATYENRSSAEKYLYQNNIIPFSIRRMAQFNKYFDLEDTLLYMDYDHLAVLQEDIMSAGQARKANSESLQIDWMAGIITFNEYRRLLELDQIPGMDIYYSEYQEKMGIKSEPVIKAEV